MCRQLGWRAARPIFCRRPLDGRAPRCQLCKCDEHSHGVKTAMTGVVTTLDDYGRPAWIGVMVLAFILFWPAGLAILAYLIWSGRMGCGRSGDMSRWQQRMTDRWDNKMQRWGRDFRGGFHRAATPPSTTTARTRCAASRKSSASSASSWSGCARRRTRRSSTIHGRSPLASEHRAAGATDLSSPATI